MSEESGQRKKPSRRDRLTPEQMEQAINAKRSYWPFMLAVAVFITLAGVEIHPIVVGIGALLDIVAIIGWGLEYH
ncbi:MAG TPA: cytochrome c oxidase subunit 4 [Ktedonobacteraceae bacterium]|nr:cytochrome c oxidase subunit 4 [Ktedonobacteraceae bacterium]